MPPLRLLLGSVGASALAGAAFVLLWSNTSPARPVVPVGLSIAVAVLAIGGTMFGLFLYTRESRRIVASRVGAVQARLQESEERFRQSQKMEALGQLTGGVAHDFNNLVTVIRCSVGLLDEYVGVDHPGNEELVQIRDAAERAGTLTRQLLAFSRRQALEPRPLDLNIVVRDLVKMLERILGSHIQVRTQLEPILPQVIADLGRMEQVIVNLAINARDAMAPIGGHLFLETHLRTLSAPIEHASWEIPPGQYVTLSVRDTGKGMTEDMLDRIFEPFFTTKEQGRGTGLGLSIAKEIIYQAGGYIAVESLLGIGTSFTLYFPTPTVVQRELVVARGANGTSHVV